MRTASSHRAVSGIGGTHHNAIANRYANYFATKPFNNTSHFMAQRYGMSRGHTHVDVGNIGAANTTRSNAHKRIAWAGSRFIDDIESPIIGAVQHDLLHSEVTFRVFGVVCVRDFG